MKVIDEITIRRVQGSDQIRQFHDLQLEYQASLPADLRHGILIRPGREEIYRDPNAAYLALIGRTAAACVRVRNLDLATDVIKGLYVKPDFRQKGIARALLEAAIGFSRGNRRNRIVLDTDPTRLRAAYELYLSSGFKECEPYEPPEYPTPTFMELTLSLGVD